MKTLLLVEDDYHLADGLIMNLEADGYRVVHVADGTQVIPEYERGNFDLILLDIMLPGKDGLTICRELRAGGHTIPILFLTARDQTEDKVEGLVAGGDDYIAKPFSMDELLARIQGIMRRQTWLQTPQEGTQTDSVSFDGRTVNFRTFEASGPGGQHLLSRKECMIVKYLIEFENEVVSRDQLLDAVWGYDAYPTNRTVDNFIVRLRRIFEDNPRKPVYFQTIRGVGYRFTRRQVSRSSNSS